MPRHPRPARKWWRLQMISPQAIAAMANALKLVILVAVVGSTACSVVDNLNSQTQATPTAIVQSTATPSPTPNTKPATEVDLTINGVHSGSREADVLSRLGKPKKTENSKEADACAGGYHRYLKYEGITIDLLSDEHKRRYFVTRMEVTSPKWEIKPGIHIGDSLEKIREAYGEPDEETSDCLYYGTKGNEGSVDFYIKDGKLVKASMTETLC